MTTEQLMMVNDSSPKAGVECLRRRAQVVF